MTRILGIDTGGTYTDGVILEMPEGTVLEKVKIPTTHENLNRCIAQCLDVFDVSMRSTVSAVCLSTTLATNAIVEGRSRTEGLILIGREPDGEIPAKMIRKVSGLLDIMGRVKVPLNYQEIEEVVQDFRGKVEAIAISGYASVRNPELELYVKKRVEQLLKIPVVCAHELTGTLGFYKRTVIADFNARLIPVIYKLIFAVRSSMEKLQMNVPLMIVKGDGTIMSDRQACHRPVETILSGPAASIRGGIQLSGKKNAVILDIGGTTSDWACVKQGSIKMRSEGAVVGDWLIHCRSAEVYTSGFGGNSRIQLERKDGFVIETERILPYCKAASLYPDFKAEVIKGSKEKTSTSVSKTTEMLEGYAALCPTENMDQIESIIFQKVKTNPHTLYWMQQNIPFQNLQNVLEEMICKGILLRIGFTPTDLLHVQKVYQRWDCEIAEVMVSLYSQKRNVLQEECIREIRKVIDKKLLLNGILAAFFFEEIFEESKKISDFQGMIEKIFIEKKKSVFKTYMESQIPLVAVGASAHVWSSCLKDHLFKNIIVPTDAEVAGAVGAASAIQAETMDILIRPDKIIGQYIVFARNQRAGFDTLESATEFAEQKGIEELRHRMEGNNLKVQVSYDDLEVRSIEEGEKEFIQRCVHISCYGSSEFEQPKA